MYVQLISLVASKKHLHIPSEALWNHVFEFYLQLLSVSEDIQVFYIKRLRGTQV